MLLVPVLLKFKVPLLLVSKVPVLPVFKVPVLHASRCYIYRETGAKLLMPRHPAKWSHSNIL